MPVYDPIIFGGLEIRFCLDETDTNRQVTLFEVSVDKGVKVPAPHYHKDFDECVYSLEGVCTFYVAGREHTLRPGESCFVPRGAVHGFENKTDGRIRFLSVITPGILGSAYFKEIASAIQPGMPPDINKVKAVMLKYGLVPSA